MSKKKVTKEQLLSMARKSAKENEDEEETKLERVENNTYSIVILNKPYFCHFHLKKIKSSMKTYLFLVIKQY